MMGTCSRTLLAETPQCRIERCNCGVLHLTIGPLTFRTTPDVLQAIAETTGNALGMMALDALDMPRPWQRGGGLS
jgi:hypothetical protein